jgi:hypothetical protein
MELKSRLIANWKYEPWHDINIRKGVFKNGQSKNWQHWAHKTADTRQTKQKTQHHYMQTKTNNVKKNHIFHHIKSNNSGTAKVKIVKNERDPPLFTSKQLIKFQKILRNTTQVIVRHGICLQTDGRTGWNQYTPLQLRCRGYNKT